MKLSVNLFILVYFTCRFSLSTDMTERVTAEAVTYKCSVCAEMVRRWFSGGNAFIIKMIEEYSHLDTSVLMSVFRHYTFRFSIR